MSRASFAAANQQMLTITSNEDGYSYDALERLERIVLSHTPKSLREALAMLNVAISEFETGGRSDGLDVRALHRIRTLLESCAET